MGNTWCLCAHRRGLSFLSGFICEEKWARACGPDVSLRGTSRVAPFGTLFPCRRRASGSNFKSPHHHKTEIPPVRDGNHRNVKGTWQEHLIFGAGPNLFVSQWLLFKNEAVNTSLFWNTHFPYGIGLLPTFAGRSEEH